MAIRVDNEAASKVLLVALERAMSEEPLPTEWISATETIGRFKSKTYTFALGTGLLARATNERVDALALKASGPNGYSARTLGHNVLRPIAFIDFGVHLGVTGREPLNNQPFFRYNRIDEMERVREPADRDYLVEALGRVNALTAEEAASALAAYLRVRMDVTRHATEFERVQTDDDLLDLASTVQKFVYEHVEGGKIGQAFVAAALELVYDEVLTGRINDPSRRHPGDVQGIRAGSVAVAAEVRQKLSSATDVMQYSSDLSRRNLRRGMFVALSPEQESLGLFRQQVWDEYGVLMSVYTNPKDFLLECAAWSGLRIESVAQVFSDAFLVRLQEAEASEAACAEWTRR